jgi:ribose 1,5-bisphosphokinase PhnN
VDCIVDGGLVATEMSWSLWEGYDVLVWERRAMLVSQAQWRFRERWIVGLTVAGSDEAPVASR